MTHALKVLPGPTGRHRLLSLALVGCLGLLAPTALAQEPPTDLQAPPSSETGHSPAVEEDPSTMRLELPAPEKQLPLDDLRKFTEVFERIKRSYVEEISDRELLNMAIRGMLSGLDPHSAYLEPQAYSDLEESTTGEFGGLGIEVGMENGFVQVIAPIDGTPADRAGIQPGDLIIKLDDTSVKGMTLEEAIQMMRGEPGTTILLTIVREGEAAPMEVELERDVIKVTSVRSEMLEPGYGYIRITQFQQKTGEDFASALQSLVDRADETLNGLIIDVRNNPGGVLQAAVEVADALIDEGMIVYTEGRIESSQLEFHAGEGDIARDIPIVVLVNAGSASASEILAGALQDHGRAVVMGTDTFGKGSVQTVMPLGNDYGIKLTTARYYTPDGRSIQAKGIRPDIEVRQARLTDVESRRSFTEADLTGHLDSGQDRPQQDQENSLEDDPLARDYQLRSALNLLKGMRIFDQRRVPR